MFSILLVFLCIMLISFLPVVFWAYTFSYIDANLASKKRFSIWVLAGIVSVIPVLYFDSVLSFFSLQFLNIFYFAYHFWPLSSYFWLTFWLMVFLLLMLVAAFIVSKIFSWAHKEKSLLIKNFIVFLGMTILVGWVFYALNVLFNAQPQLNLGVGQAVAFGDLLFNSLKLVIFYYLLIAIIEESSKHFHFLWAGTEYVIEVKTAVLFAIYVALGFSFIENILYFTGLYFENGFSFELVKVYFYRSTFALFVHVLCSSMIAFYFAKWMMKSGFDFSFSYIRVFLFGIFVSIFLHAFFDISLTLWLAFVMFLYFIGGYLFVTSIFYREYT